MLEHLYNYIFSKEKSPWGVFFFTGYCLISKNDSQHLT